VLHKPVAADRRALAAAGDRAERRAGRRPDTGAGRRPALGLGHVRAAGEQAGGDERAERRAMIHAKSSVTDDSYGGRDPPHSQADLNLKPVSVVQDIGTSTAVELIWRKARPHAALTRPLEWGGAEAPGRSR
jgi:hypothetical protein